MSFTVRPYQPADLPAIRDLVERLWPVPLEREFFWAFNPRPEEAWPQVWVAQADGNFAGFARLDHNDFLPDDTLAWIVVNVEPAHQGQSIGRTLVAVATDAAQACGQQTLQTSARSDLSRLTSFWQAQGFSEIRRGGPLLVWNTAPDPIGLASAESVESFETFLKRDDAAELLASVLNPWSVAIHSGLDMPEGGHLSGQDWLDTLAEVSDPVHSQVLWRSDELSGLITFCSWEGNTDELALNLDFTLSAPVELSRPQMPVAALVPAFRQALAKGVRRIVLEAQPHFGWAVQQLVPLGGRLEERPVWVVMKASLDA